MNDFEFDPRMAVMLRQMDITGMANDPKVLHPSLQQYEMQPGQRAVMVTTDCELDQDFTLLTMLDPSEYAEQYPDWEARVGRDHRLCEWRSQMDNDGSIGWFQLGRIIPLDTQEHYDELLKTAVLEPDRKGAPQWLNEIYGDYLEGLRQVDPDQVYAPVECAQCQSKNVELHVKKTIVGTGMVGSKVTYAPNGDKIEEYGVIRQPHVQENMEAHLHCNDCEYRGNFNQAEIESITIQSMGIV
jgi:hypothetical protein